MFDFGGLDEVDQGGAAPEWLKWQSSAQPGRPAARPRAVLEDEREEQFAAGDEEYVFERLEVPFLPEEGAFDPLSLFDDSTDAIEDRIAMYNGQVVINFVSTTYEEHMYAEHAREERKAYIEEMHENRLAVANASAGKARQERIEKKETGRFYERKPFTWRDVHSPLVGNPVGLPDGGTFAEYVLSDNAKLIKTLTKVRNTVFLPSASMVQILSSIAHWVRPAPSGPRIRSNAPWHLALTDVFFPSPFIVDDGSEYIDKKEEAPTFVHMVAMSVNKETGEILGKNLLENIKFKGRAPKYPKRSGLRA